MKRISVTCPFSRDDLYEKRVFLHARINECSYKGIGTLYPLRKADQLYIDVHLDEQASKDAYIIHIINLNQRLTDLLKRNASEEYDFELVEPGLQSPEC